jgi:hypothetical protein
MNLFDMLASRKLYNGNVQLYNAIESGYSLIDFNMQVKSGCFIIATNSDWPSDRIGANLVVILDDHNDALSVKASFRAS